ncbi:L-aspartate dehydrogenase [Candidatus Methanoperedenaceae archaeon GB50]|nr:L-aspartate dehydrogenase [Candidatus Methanoperedenaceae archaeon GB50]
MTKLGLIGCGAIGTILAKAIEERLQEKFMLKVIFDISSEKARALKERLHSSPIIAPDFSAFLAQSLDIAIEAASQEAVKEYGEKILSREKDLMIMSIGALLEDNLFERLKTIAQKKHRRIYLPSGAVVGIDGIKAAALAGLDEVVLTTRKPPAGLKGAPYIEEREIDLENITKAQMIYKGPAEEAVKYFPANVNVAAVLSLAGIGKKKTKVKIIADPNIHTNQHEIKVKGKFGQMICLTKNLPCPDSPRTSYLAALSAIKTLENISAEVVIGT